MIGRNRKFLWVCLGITVWVWNLLDQSLSQAGCRVQLLLLSLPLCDLLQISPLLFEWVILRETQTLWLSPSIPWSPEILRQLWWDSDRSQRKSSLGRNWTLSMPCGHYYMKIIHRAASEDGWKAYTLQTLCTEVLSLVLKLHCIVLFLLSSFFFPYISEANPNLVEFISLHALGWTTHHRAELRKIQILVYSYCNLLHFSTCMVFFFSLFYFSFQDSSQMVYYISASIQTCSGFNCIAKELAGKVFIHWSWRNLQEQSSINTLCFIVEAGAGMAFLGWCSGKQLGLTALAAQEYACNKWIYSTCVYNWLLFYISSVVLV